MLIRIVFKNYAPPFPPQAKIVDADYVLLEQPFTILDLLQGTERTSLSSSPGVDGIPYAIYKIMLQHPATAKLALTVFNDALLSGIFPASWLKTVMCLLPKKGDLNDLRNWRPLSMICCDAKIFTRLLNHRLMPFMNHLISKQQAGFMPGRFIGDNGMILHATKLIAERQSSSCIALLLDQEKAYDRIHPDYLSSILHSFNLTSTLINSLTSLFFSTQIHANINGHISSDFILQHRGILQGDPISSLLFNMAFDPFLRSIQQNSAFKGFNLPLEAPPHGELDDLSDAFNNLYLQPTATNYPMNTITNTLNTISLNPPSPSDTNQVKILAYADDTLVYLRDAEDFTLLQQAVSQYMRASNSLLNYHKTTAISLSGRPLIQWRSLLASHNTTHWHDRSSPSPLIYLGYPFCSNITQRNIAFQQLHDTVRNATHIHSQRNVSIRGRVTILNTLIYSKLWHVLRLSVFTKSQLPSLRSLGTSFINHRIFPRLSFDILTLPRNIGGLGLLDPLRQQQALQWRWVCPIILSAMDSPVLPRYAVPSMNILQYALSWFYYSTAFSRFLYYFLFPTARRHHWFPHRPCPQKTYLNPCLNLQACFDAFAAPHYAHCSVDAVTCLSLPLYEIFLPSLPTNYPTNIYPNFRPPHQLLVNQSVVEKLLVRGVFLFDTESQALRLRQSSAQFARHRTVCSRIANLISTHQLLLKPFFRRCCDPNPHSSLDLTFPPTLRSFCSGLLVPGTTTTSFSWTRLPRRIPLNSIT